MFHKDAWPRHADPLQVELGFHSLAGFCPVVLAVKFQGSHGS